ncbi:hypothetical protein BaRGS_00000544, partial [Batillaria attramentaria]
NVSVQYDNEHVSRVFVKLPNVSENTPNVFGQLPYASGQSYVSVKGVEGLRKRLVRFRPALLMSDANERNEGCSESCDAQQMNSHGDTQCNASLKTKKKKVGQK